jgi:hypothetical protein
VARQALSGFVDKDVGSATHYHAAYVAPYWAPKLVKMTRVGEHIFYRWDGAWGEPDAFTGRYSGHEAILTPALLRSASEVAEAPEPAPERKVTLAVAGQVRTYRVAAPGETSDAPADNVGVLHASRRQPTPDEVQAINARLAAMEAQMRGAPPVAANTAQAALPASAQVGG